LDPCIPDVSPSFLGRPLSIFAMPSWNELWPPSSLVVCPSWLG
jgi:hypothetical protein